MPRNSAISYFNYRRFQNTSASYPVKNIQRFRDRLESAASVENTSSAMKVGNRSNRYRIDIFFLLTGKIQAPRDIVNSHEA